MAAEPPGILAAGANRSGRKPLATPGAAGAQHVAATDSRLAGAEAVAALADEVAGLKGALHRKLSRQECGTPPCATPEIRIGPLGERRAIVKPDQLNDGAVPGSGPEKTSGGSGLLRPERVPRSAQPD